MNEADAVEVLNALDDLGVEWWLLGGWGVDALLGEVTRPHKDLDVAVFASDLPQIERRLANYRRFREDEYPGFILLRDHLGHTLDLLLLRDEVDGAYRQELAGGRIVRWPRDETRACGRISDRSVRCASAAFQVRERQRRGAEEEDRKDVSALLRRFPFLD